MNLRRRMRSIPFQDIRLTDRFWTRWQTTLTDVTIEAEYNQLVRTGRIENFRRAAGTSTGEYQGLFFNDSDVYKWAEACAYALTLTSSPKLKALLNDTIEAIVAAQEPDGYLNTFFQLKHPTLKWRNLHTMHELYCGGHLIEAGVALFECTGDRRLIEVATKFADHVASIFGPGKRRGYCGHQEIELALLRLAKATGNADYAELALWMVEERGQKPSLFEEQLKDSEALTLSPWAMGLLTKNGEYRGEYAQDHAPLRDQTEIVGHAVRAMYFYIAAAELFEGKNDERLEKAIQRIWDNLTKRRMYVTGGIGPSASNEGFSVDFDLPNLTAYAETCASCGLIFWAHGLLELTGQSEYAEVMERALYNGAISGISLSGDRFFYTNPLESRGGHERKEWFECACCPPNIARLIGSLGRYVAGQSEDSFLIHFPAGFTADVEIAGTRVKLELEGDYPWSGKFIVTVTPEKPVEFDLKIRIPDWCDDVTTELPGLEREAEFEDGYAVFRKLWAKGDVLSVDLNMEPKWVEADPRVRDNLGRSVLTYGPLIYCAESHDNGWAPQLFTADSETPIVEEASPILEGVTTLSVTGLLDIESFPDQLYAELGSVDSREAEAVFIPYYAWCNRGPSSMQVWVRRS